MIMLELGLVLLDTATYHQGSMGRSEHPFLMKWFVILFYPDGQERRMYIYEGPLDAAPVAEAWER